jgi:hypothetical protein
MGDCSVKRALALAVSAFALAACSDSSPVAPDASPALDAQLSRSGGSSSRTAYVTNSNNDGAGSFRAAVELANNNPAIGEIEFTSRVRTINLSSTVTFSGPQDLEIEGDDAVIDASGAGGTAFLVTGGGDLSVEELTVRNAPAEGITVEVPSTATGTIRISLEDLIITGNKGHGILINDQVDPTTEDDVQPNGDGSAASLDVTVIDSRFFRNGYSVSDRDGLRVNEGGEGDLRFTVRNVKAEENAADGIEIDERGNGDVRLAVRELRVARNGPLDPADLDDGFDIDEYNDGGILGYVVDSEAIDNFEEGFDFNENNAGDFRVDMIDVQAIGNGEEGIDYEEDDDFAGGGELVTTMVGIIANGNGGDGGLKIREKGEGNLVASVTGVVANENTASGIAIREDANGNLDSRIVGSRTLTNGAHGIDFDENSDGILTAVVRLALSSANTQFGIRADQGGTGSGTLGLFNAQLTGNTGGTTTGGGVTVSTTP